MPKAAVLFTIAMITCWQNGFTQSSLRLVRPVGVIRAVSTIANVTLAENSGNSFKQGDTALRVIHVFNAASGSRILSIELKITPDSSLGKMKCIVANWVSTDSVTQLWMQKQDSFPCHAIHATLVASADITAHAPTEDQYYVTAETAHLYNDTLKHDSVKSVRKPLLHISGSITEAGQVSDGRFNGQEIPQNFLRTYVAADIEVSGVPFTLSYLHSTESNTNTNRISNVGISFDYHKFHQQLKSNLEREIRSEKTYKIEKITPPNLPGLHKEFSQLASKMTSPSYLKDVAKYRTYVERGNSDSLFRQTSKYKRGMLRFEKYQSDSIRLNQLTGMRSNLLDHEINYDLFSKRRMRELEKPKTFKANLKKYRLYRPSQNLLLSLKRFDLGTFSPDYSTLVLNGVSLTGINIELNPGQVYGAALWGTSVSNFSNPISFDVSGGRTIMAGRVGIGRTEHMLFAVTVLKGEDKSTNDVRDSNYQYYTPRENYVMGASLTYRFTQAASIELEYASAQNQDPEQGHSTTQSYYSLLDNRSQTYSNAWSGKFAFNSAASNTKLHIAARMIDPFYYSFGTPFLRKDNLRLEAKIDQGLLKNMLKSTFTYRHDKDNLYGFKENTSTVNSFIYTLHIRVKKYPYLTLSYAPSYQELYNSVTKTHMHNTVVTYMATAIHLVQNRGLSSSTSLNYMYQFNASNTEGMDLYEVNQYSITEALTFDQLDLAVTSSATYTMPQHNSDTGRFITLETAAGTNLFRKKINTTGGYAYQKDYSAEARNIVFISGALNVQKSLKVQVRLERHYIERYRSSSPSNTMNLGRISLTKFF